MYTKEDIFNLALGALLLNREISDADNDRSNEARVLRTHWTTAFYKTLEDLDLDSLSSQTVLELLEEDPEDFSEWKFVYAYPANCAFFRRIKTDAIVDNRATHEPKLVRLFEGQKAIFCNKEEAVAEYIPSDLDLSVLSASAGLAVAYNLARLSAPLIVGKGAARVAKSLDEKYMIAKADAQEVDQLENTNFIDERTESEFVDARLR